MSQPTKHIAQTTGAKCRGTCGGKIHKGEEIIRIALGKFCHVNCWF